MCTYIYIKHVKEIGSMYVNHESILTNTGLPIFRWDIICWMLNPSSLPLLVGGGSRQNN